MHEPELSDRREGAAAAAAAASTALIVLVGDEVHWCNAAAGRLVEPYGGDWHTADGPVRHLVAHTASDTALRWTAPDGSVRWWRVRRQVVAGGVAVELVDESDHDGGLIAALPGTTTWEWDAVDDSIAFSDEFSTLLGLAAGRRVSWPEFAELVHPDDLGALRSVVRRALDAGTSWTCTARVFHADRAAVRTVEVYGAGAGVLGDGPLRVVGSVRDVTELQNARRRLHFLSDHDPQTGLVSRHRVMRRLAECAAGPEPAAVVVLDVDRLHEINERHGSSVGDHVLRALAGILHSVVGNRATLGRIGGDRFAVVLVGPLAGQAFEIGAHLSGVVDRTPITTGSTTVRAAISVGVADVVAGDADGSLGHAVLALDEAKRTGRNRAVRFTDALRLRGRGGEALVHRVSAALDDGTMMLHAQPIVDVRSGRTLRHELLARLQDGQEPRVGPADFMPLMERTGLVHRFDRWVVGRAVAALATPGARASGLRLEANLSGRSLEDHELGSWILADLERHQVPPGRLGVEVTETAAVTELDAARSLACQLVEAGVGFALDDFGCGFGSFSYLKHLRFTSIKIAGDFVAEVDRDDTDRAIVGAVVGVARQMGLVTVAEQVDRPELVEVVHRLGVDCVQGYHLGRPVPLAELLADR